MTDRERAEAGAQCRHCRSAIDGDASVCPSCGQSQKPPSLLRRAAIFGGIVTGLITAVTHTLSVFPAARNFVWPPAPRVQVLSFDSHKRVVIANESPVDLYVTHIHYALDVEQGGFLPRAEALLPGLPPEQSQRLEAIVAGRHRPFAKNRGVALEVRAHQVVGHELDSDSGGRDYARGFDEAQWWEIVARVAALGRHACAGAFFFHPEDRRYLGLLEETRGSLNTFPAVGEVWVYSPLRRKKEAVAFEAVGTLKLSGTAECEDAAGFSMTPRGQSGAAPPD